MKLNFKTFYTYHLLEPWACERKKDRIIALVSSIAIGILSLGIFHGVVYLSHRCRYRSISKTQTLDSSLSKIQTLEVKGHSFKDCQVIKKIRGWHPSYQLKLPDGRMMFWKWCGDESLRESAATKLASYLTDGLVPKAKIARYEGKLGILANYYSIDTAPFDHLLEKTAVDFDFLNTTQIHQLFCHVITNRLVSNWDTHQDQYAVDCATGNLLGFDKGHSFSLFSLDGSNRERINSLDLTKNYWLTDDVMAKRKEGKKVYVRIDSTFAKAIEKKEIKEFDVKNPIVQNFFHKCKNIPYSRVSKYFKDLANDMYPTRPEEFIYFLWKRIVNIEEQVFEYFGWQKFNILYADK